MKQPICLLTVMFTFFTSRAICQGFSFNTTGAPANSSAILDVSSTSKGILIPRMTSTQRTTGISSPAQGLMVYQTDAPQGFYYYDGSSWNYVGTGTVTSVSSGNLSPIFTSTVTSSSTTPAISYSLSNSSAYTVLTNSTNATTAPTYGKVVPQALNGSNSPTSSTFYRGDGSWSTHLGGNIRTVTSNTTLLSSDQIVAFSHPSGCCLSITLFSPSLVPKGYQLNLINMDGNSFSVILIIPSGMTVIYGGGALVGSTALPWGYQIQLVSDGASTWYLISGQ